ncbi:hypothetical protein V6N12_060955 [Hibiscus sabdariffa]|uniref:RNase H type-1 domain-containing protein n=1 Tax=Hibiscus sabdariffa TaxID=183260 RepID=A0ABR2DVL9_9ROSI
MNTIEPSLRSTISHMEVAQELLEDIQECFSIANGPRIQQLKAEFAECKQKALEKKREEEKVHQFLMGLDETLYGTGHDSDSCFELVGYPEWWGDRPRETTRGYGQNKGRQQFVNSGSKGHGGVKANAVQASTIEVVGNSIISDSDKTVITGLSNEQWETLRTLLSGAKMGTNEKMTGLPNGNQIVATKEGTMVFDRKLTLNHVLYVPSLMCNLISLSQVLDETNCVAQFTDKFFVIQDRTSRMLIGAGEQRGELYFFRTMVTTTAMKMSGQSSFDMWHKRLGHPSSKVVELIPNVGFSVPFATEGWKIWTMFFVFAHELVTFGLELLNLIFRLRSLALRLIVGSVIICFLSRVMISRALHGIVALLLFVGYYGKEDVLYWSRPPRGWIKANVDASVHSGDGHAAIGGVLRDENGCWILGFRRSIGCCSVLVAELWAVQDMLARAWSLDIRRLVLETNCMEVVQLLNCSSTSTVGNTLVRLIMDWTRENWQLVIRYVPRVHNQLTDRFASLGRTAPRDGILFSNPTVDLVSLVDHDVARSLQAPEGPTWREVAHTICFNLMDDPWG